MFTDFIHPETTNIFFFPNVEKQSQFNLPAHLKIPSFAVTATKLWSFYTHTSDYKEACSHLLCCFWASRGCAWWVAKSGQPLQRRFQHSTKLHHKKKEERVPTWHKPYMSSVNVSAMGKRWGEAIIFFSIWYSSSPEATMGAERAPQKRAAVCWGASQISLVIYCHLITGAEKLKLILMKKPDLQLGWVFSELAELSSRYKRGPQLNLGDTERRPSASHELHTSARPPQQQISSPLEG